MKAKSITYAVLVGLLLTTGAAHAGVPASIEIESSLAAPATESRVDVQWAAEAGKTTPAEQAALVERFRAALELALQARQPLPRPVELKARIDAVNTVSRALNTASALLLFLPFDRGGATVTIEAFDTQTGEVVLSMTDTYSPPMRKLKARFKKLAPAELALDRLADKFSVRLADSALRPDHD